MWSEWKPLDAEVRHTGAGAYEVRMVRGKDKAVPISRFLARDPDGLLVIGETSRIEHRRNRFVRGMNKGGGHSEGNLLHVLIERSPLNQRFPGYRLQFRYYRVADKVEAQRVQEQLIKQYICRFGEVPPLNSAIPDRYGNWPLYDPRI